MEFWHKQTKETPLYPDILWSRPENKLSAGKLLIIGGNKNGFTSINQAYQIAQNTGAGSIRVVLPDALKKTLGPLGPYDFAPSTPSGSFATKAFNDLLQQSTWADCVLLAGDMGRNSETAILLEKFTSHYHGPLVVTKDTADYFINFLPTIPDSSNITLIINLGQLQKLGTALKFDTPFLLDMGVMMHAQALHRFTKLHNFTIMTKDLNNIIVAKDGLVITTNVQNQTDLWQTESAAKASVLLMQNPTKPLQSITTSVIV
ncbi:hypothetical protein KC867_02200 [Candidatus Saccharibacteria bacterium]|nr:hypothetical protein [Candidatus Saccharibacteria bacterium]